MATDSLARQQPAQTLHDYLRRLNGLWLAPLLVVALALGGYSLYQVHQQRRAEVQTMAARLAADVDADLQRRLHGLQALAVSISQSHSGGSLRDWHKEARDYDLTFNAPVLLVDANRRVLFSSRLALGTPLPLLPKPPGRLDLEGALATGRPKIGDVLFGPIVGQRVVPITVPVAGTPIALVGVVVVDHYAELILRQRLPATWQAAVVDSVGQLIGGTVHEDAWAGRMGPPAAGGDSRTGGPRALSESRLAVEGTVSAPFRVIVRLDPLDFYRPHLQIGLALLLSVTMAVGGVAFVARRASQAVHQAEETERERIGRELHDGLQQELAAAKMFLELAAADVHGGKDPTELLDRGRKGLEKVMQGIDDAVRDLRPRELSMLGLSASLEQLVQQLRVVGRLRVELKCVGPQDAADALPQPVANVLYRIAQESLNNVRKHARASFVHVALDLSNPAEVRLAVSDDGIGFSWLAGHDGPSVGLRGMLHRAKSLHGELRVERGLHGDAQRGTTVTVRIPLEPQPAP